RSSRSTRRRRKNRRKRPSRTPARKNPERAAPPPAPCRSAPYGCASARLPTLLQRNARRRVAPVPARCKIVAGAIGERAVVVRRSLALPGSILATSAHAVDALGLATEAPSYDSDYASAERLKGAYDSTPEADA